ncbi:hypothetical protein MKW94_023671 [Papaver nudicaule]|uniref:E2 ubiquitin-conjugating enzyme n=1 Tax=Papaver nudicaule TaxID=74823 RepID=A0AA41V686_PAPNU|nr:hypothetical protein [Papaver nudicaule]MCL7052279.1 hypothetical protein [Papaver nudicaule]
MGGCASKPNKKLKTIQVVPDEIIEIDGEEDIADSSKVNKKFSTYDKGKTIMSTEPVEVNDISDNDEPEMYDSDDVLNLEGSDYEYEELYQDGDFKSYDDEVVALQAKFDAQDLPPGAEASVPWLVEDDKPIDRTRPPVPCSSSTVPKQFLTSSEEDDEAIVKFRAFKKFDTVDDFSDHFYKTKSVTKTKQASSKWTKTIQQDWRLLEKDLPDTIFVRVYEGRLDLLRAVIGGAAGTPYHDGLFFFDVHYPSNYPDTPPLVHYHAHNLRLNPNLYNCGKVCLSLLNTWSGRKDEMWTPNKSNMLQVLLSIQALVLNTKPYFNEPGWAPSAGTVQGEKSSQKYNESTFILSCRTILYTLKNPPKHFEDYVLGHFRLRAHPFLLACKAYIEGAQVGCVVEGVQDVDEGQTSSSSHFKSEVGTMAGNLVPIFIQKGAKNCEQFVCLGDAFRLAKANYTNIFKKDFYEPVQDQVAAALPQALPFGHSHAQYQPFHHSPAQFISLASSFSHSQIHNPGTGVYVQPQAQSQAQPKAHFGKNINYFSY